MPPSDCHAWAQPAALRAVGCCWALWQCFFLRELCCTTLMHLMLLAAGAEQLRAGSECAPLACRLCERALVLSDLLSTARKSL